MLDTETRFFPFPSLILFPAAASARLRPPPPRPPATSARLPGLLASEAVCNGEPQDPRCLPRKKHSKKPSSSSWSAPLAGAQTSSAEANAVPQLSSYALGVLDKASGTLKIVPIAANKVSTEQRPMAPNFDLSGNSCH
ncbi:hypothetical protein GUJ93_ZPchr0013g34699 [Zizania palustris]|uniref:Uncharacterized protein n=1 Tax=Zizania palustris TaxID=103762 RepID=A0A8J6C096_ZIZPA|nr:hypothetical protein GUJ93_ZPchr0013g34699 [Zizania palustris]